MAGTIKIELDIPDFKNTLGINIELVKDGRGVTGNYYTSTPTNDIPYNPGGVRYDTTELPTKPLPITCTDNNGNVEVSTTTTTTPKKRKSGNMMNVEF